MAWEACRARTQTALCDPSVILEGCSYSARIIGQASAAGKSTALSSLLRTPLQVPATAVKEDAKLTPAAAFARTIGLREGGKFLSFLGEGHTPSVRIAHPRTGVKLHCMSEADKAAFHERFLTLTSLAAELGQHRNAVAAMIRAAGIMPFVPNGRDFGTIYLRNDLGRILGPGRDKPTKA